MRPPLLIPGASPVPVRDGYRLPLCRTRIPVVSAAEVHNVITRYRQATPAQLDDGEGWYYRAATWCQNLATRIDHTCVTFNVVAGVVAALSPACSWSRNKQDAEAVIQHYLNRDLDEPRCATYGKNVDKAYAILSGEPIRTTLAPNPRRSGNKTLAFYNRIIAPWRKDIVCIDRHALRAMGETKLSITAYRYRCAELTYLRAARQLRVHPAAVQPVVWTVQRETR